MNRQNAKHRFDPTGCTEQVAGHRLCRADRNAGGPFTEHLFDGLGLNDVCHRRCAMRIDVADLVFADAGIVDRQLHAADRAFTLFVKGR